MSDESKRRLKAAAKNRAKMEENFGVDGLYIKRPGAKKVSAESRAAAKKTLEEIATKVRACKRCDLHIEANKAVPGDGYPNAELVFVGEGPGADEDRQGIPFVGRAGKLLDKIIAAMGLKREEIFIANVVKHRPPGNRTPTKQEIEACWPLLIAQLEAIHPKVICTLGAPASQTLLQTDLNIGKLRGKFHRFPENADILVMPTYHPAYLLRNPAGKKPVWEDMQKIIKQLGRRLPK